MARFRTVTLSDAATIIRGDCLRVMGELPAASVDAIVTDPPYGLEFMGKAWDHGVPGVAFWEAALRVAKPGCHLLAFGGTRTFHRLACAIEDAGWQIRDTIMWVYGSGFPKSLDVGKAIDKAAGAEREVVGRNPHYCENRKVRIIAQDSGNDRPWLHDPEKCAAHRRDITAPATAEAAEWNGWGTALKPAWEPILVARKPLDGTVAANVLEHGCGALNVDGCRVPSGEQLGRFPANLIHDGSEEVVGLFPVETQKASQPRTFKRNVDYHGIAGQGGAFVQKAGQVPSMIDRGDTGSAARFFYCAKASRRERNEGLHNLPRRVSSRSAYGDKGVFACLTCRTTINTGRKGFPAHCPKCGEPTGWIPERNDGSGTVGKAAGNANNHPTVKPIALMKYLCRLVTPPGGLVLDPFTGSGSTGRAAVAEGFRFLGIELDPGYATIAAARIRYEQGRGARDWGSYQLSAIRS